MAITASEARRNLESRGYAVAYGILARYKTNIEVREHSVLLQGKQALKTCQEIAATEAPAETLVRRFHYELLELLTHICMFVEDFSFLAYALKHHPHSLHWPIHFTGQQRGKTLDAMAGMHGNSVRSRFRVPRVPKLGLGSRGEQLVRGVLDAYVRGLRSDLGAVAEFNRRGFFRVYNEYKHTFDIFTGEIGRQTGLSRPVIIVRATKSSRSKAREELLLLDASLELLRYLHGVFGAVSNLINCLLWNSLDYMLYADGRYLVKLPKDYSIGKDALEEYYSLPGSKGLHWSNSHASLPTLTFAGAAKNKAESELRSHHIATLNQPLIRRGARGASFGIQTT